MKHIGIFLFSVSLLAISALADGTGPRDEFLRTLPVNQDDPRCRAALMDLWMHASKKPLGKEDDEVQVRIISLPEGVRIVSVRWLSADTAIAQGDRDKIRFLDFFIREDGKWTFVRQYSLGRAKGT